MAKPLQKFEYKGPQNDAAVDALLVKLSQEQDGVFFARGVFGLVNIYQFKNVSSIPDAFVGMSPRPELFKGGKVVKFNPAQVIREQNRGIFGDA